MIVKNKNCSFNSRFSLIKYDQNYVTVTTAKEGLRDGLSTMIMDGQHPTGRYCAKIIYSNSLKTKDRQQFHKMIVEGINVSLNEDNFNLHDSIELMGNEMKKDGIITELINIA
ncbi:MAG TPA: hypothetical protein ENH35_02325 [Candidatus Moranbacteria bacterium]|nr:hypothetical protein [Candidatus Moranbacteria bacterium]